MELTLALISAPLTIPYNLDQEVDEVTDMFKGLSKKKKPSKKSKTAEADGEGEFDPSKLKKKKSGKSKTKPDTDFEAKLAEAGVTEDVETQAEEAIPEGDPVAGTGIWAHDATQPIPYALLSQRFFSLIESQHPDHMVGGAKIKIPPPQCMREGSRKTVWANMVEICKRMNRRYELPPRLCLNSY